MEGKKIGEIKKAITYNKNLAESDYNVPENRWAVYDSSLDDFGSTFQAVFPNDDDFIPHMGEIFAKYIQDILSKGNQSEGEKNNLTALELGGPGSKLFSQFPYLFRRTVGVCLGDIRKDIERDIDTRNNHFVIPGDILDPRKNNWTKLHNQIMQKLDANKTDLIISRMMGPLNHIHMNPIILNHILKNWYGILNENGLMFVQFEYDTTRSRRPSPTEKRIQELAKAIKEKCPEIDIQVNTNNRMEAIFRLHKKKGAPDELPPVTQLFK